MGVLSEKAVRYFSSVPKAGNCAQCVAMAFSAEDVTAGMKSCGGGGAPGGMCGALYAALTLAEEESRERIRTGFMKENGSVFCHELKQMFHVPCEKCVETAALLLEKEKNKVINDITEGDV